MKRHAKDKAGFLNEMDIAEAMKGWAFEPGQVNVRLIRGNDGKPKLQLRLDLGLLQMELEGRPDGKRPHRATTELDFQIRKLNNYHKKTGSEAGFQLSSRDCQALREESAMFYHRYLSLFVLEQYEAVVRDTQHNLDVLNLCSAHGLTEYDRMCLEQYRPYIMMMNARAKACDALRQGYVQTAIAYLRGGIKAIAHLMPKHGRRKMLRGSHEATILLEMLKQIRGQLTPDPRVALRMRLDAAVKAEHYEEAAALRDELLKALTSISHRGAAGSGGALEETSNPGSSSMPPAMPKSEVHAKKVRKPRQKKNRGGAEGG